MDVSFPAHAAIEGRCIQPDATVESFNAAVIGSETIAVVFAERRIGVPMPLEGQGVTLRYENEHGPCTTWIGTATLVSDAPDWSVIVDGTCAGHRLTAEMHGTANR